jgi:hypothetical protein
MSAVDSCADNTAAESFFGVLTRERVNRDHYRTRAEAMPISLTTSNGATIRDSSEDCTCSGRRNDSSLNCP